MIAFCVVLLFVVINLVLKKKDLKAELKAYRAYGYQMGEAGQGQDENGEVYENRGGTTGAYDSQGNYVVGQGENPGAYDAQGSYADQAGAYSAQGNYADQAGSTEAYGTQGGYVGQAGNAGAYGTQGGYVGQAGNAGAYDVQGGYAGQNGADDAYTAVSGDSADQTLRGTSEGGRGKWQSSAQGQMTIRFDASQKAENGQTQGSAQHQAVSNDDPATVPKPSRAKKKSKQMPEYQKSKPAPEYQPNTENGKKDIEVTMIDL
jgi:hypothetical protein